ncbi:hypothetical protein [Microbacterium paludicola]|uniref:hypothetical protein n=1 Tax=Microbacterium paludicola TaxID=300019 RepID=UPI0011A019A0|nr:hypothetical protein [Microbacterium paludicola]
MKKFVAFLVGGIGAAGWALYLVLVELQQDLTVDVLFRPSWVWLLVLIALSMLVVALLNLPRRQGKASVDPSAAVTAPPVQPRIGGSAVSVPGVIDHGRLRAHRKIGTPRRHEVVWKETGTPAGELVAGSGAHWDVLNEDGSYLGTADSVTMGLAMIDLAAMGWRLDTNPAPGPQSANPTIVDANRAALGRTPTLLGVEFLHPAVGGPFGDQSYRTEAWQLTNGDRVVIVSDNGGTSLMNISEHIATAIDTRWAKPGRPLMIIEEWNPPTVMGHRFVVSNRNGGHIRVDFDELDSVGIILPRDKEVASS